MYKLNACCYFGGNLSELAFCKLTLNELFIVLFRLIDEKVNNIVVLNNGVDVTQDPPSTGSLSRLSAPNHAHSLLTIVVL